MKQISMLQKLLLSVLFSGMCLQAGAYQLADARPPAPVSMKYIFYWGKHQCDLSENNQYHGKMAITVGEFRQIMLNLPNLWNGKELVANLTFKLEGATVVVSDYLAQLAQLDAYLSQRIKRGSTLLITELPLHDGIQGNIDIQLKEKDDVETTVFGYSSSQDMNQMNTVFFERVVWGREDIYETSDRDFFTVREFWQTIRQEPLVEWHPYIEPRALRVDLQLTTKELTSFSVVAKLGEEPYASYVSRLETYKHMINPGATVILNLQTAAQYELMYRKTMFIVEEGDPRLRLRKKRDQHEVKLRWGAWSEKIKGLYLQTATGTNGERIPTDKPISRNSGLTFANSKMFYEENLWHQTAPEFFVDDEPVSGDVAFQVTLSDSVSFWVHASNFEPDTIKKYFHTGMTFDKIRFDSIQVEGYDLPPMSFNMYLVILKDPILVRNDLETLQKASASFARVRLEMPVKTEKGYKFSFQIPELAAAAISIFEPDGWNSFVARDMYGPGNTEVEVPFSAFRNYGKHIAFLNTPFGVVKVEFEH
ncbi:MAG: hypothetical protein JNJ57_07935 [Saprospiraceae bacterium]|nr:hypothetical protein [Saprospiraceae bacterium]